MSHVAISDLIPTQINRVFARHFFIDQRRGLSEFNRIVAAIVFRLILGVLLILAAKQSKYPVAIKAIGFLAIIAALYFLIIGHEKFIQLIGSFLPELKSYTIVTAIVAIILGGFLFYAFLRKKRN